MDTIGGSGVKEREGGRATVKWLQKGWASLNFTGGEFEDLITISLSIDST